MQVMFRQIERMPAANHRGKAEVRLKCEGRIDHIVICVKEDTRQHTAAGLLNRRVASSCARRPHEVD